MGCGDGVPPAPRGDPPGRCRRGGHGPGAFLLCVQFYHRAPGRARPRVAESGLGTCVVNVPLPARAHEFRIEGDTVVDTVTDLAGIADARLSEGGDQSSAKP